MTEQLGTRIDVIELNEDQSYGKFVIMPLERGYGITLGNSLRRVLLSSLPGAAISKINIQGVVHEMSTIKGVKEDVAEIILNLKGVNIKKFGDEDLKLSVSAKGPTVLTAKDIISDANIELANPDHFIATLNEDANVEMEITISNGKGYRLAEFNKTDEDVIGDIAIDSLFSPVKKVNFDVDSTRVGQVIDYDKLTLEVWTNGTVTAQDAISEGSEILINYLELFRGLPEYEVKQDSEEAEDSVDEETLYSINIEDLDLSLRSFNCLKRANINTVGDIASYKKSDIIKIKNFGKKSLDEVEDKLEELGVSLKDENTDEE
ncbi:MAG: DNA-directed RNA polymerase subunit alpha [Finegoldia sp.]|nr:DNA-directed RNA polymerase subunit alpha [Finegoldia sp.]